MRNPQAFAALLAFATLPLLAQRPHPTLLVANQTDHTLSLIDPAAATQKQAIDVGGITGHEVAVTPDGSTAFVPIYGNSGVGKPGTDGHTMAVIDLKTRAVIDVVDFGKGVRPHCPVYDTHRKVLYVTTELNQTFTILDPRTHKILGAIPTGQDQSHMLVLSHDGRFAYTANVGPGTVSAIDLNTRKPIAVIAISSDTQRISISNDDREVFTADQTKPQLAVIDTSTNKVKTWVPLPALAYGTAPTPDGRWLLVTLRPANQVAVVDLATLKVVRTIDVIKGPTEVLVRPDGKTAYVSGDGKVSAIDLATWAVTSTIEAGKGADGLAWAR